MDRVTLADQEAYRLESAYAKIRSTMKTLSRLTLLAGTCTTTFLWPHSTSAFECSRAPGAFGTPGPSLSWFSRTIPFTLHADGTSDVPGTEELDAVRAAFAVWTGVEGCASPGVFTDIIFEETPTTTADRIGYDWLSPDDNENLIIFRDQGWPHQQELIGMSAVTFNQVTGEIIDVDIELNSQHSDFTVGDTGVAVDVLNTMVYNVGRLLGIGYSSVEGASMYPMVAPGDTSKRDLACDDRDAVVFKYPSGLANAYCSPPEESCGFCAPPRELLAVPTFTVVETRDGVTGCQ